MADQPSTPAIDPKELDRLNSIFGSSVVQKSNFINQPLPNYQDFVKYMNANQGKMTYPLAPRPTQIRYQYGNPPNDQGPRYEGKPYRIQYNNVVDYKSPYYDDLPMRHTTPGGRTFTYWEYPERVARFANMIRSASPDWQAPNWMNKDAVLEAYDYMKARNGTGDWTQWKALSDDDPGVQFLQSLAPPPIEFVLPTEAAQAQQVLTPEQIAQQQPVDWDTLPKWMQTYLGIFAPQAEGIYDRPNANRLTASAMQSLMIGIGVGAGVSAIATPWAGIPAGLAVMGLLTYQNYTGNQIPGLNEIMIPFNILAEVSESAIGNAMLASVEGLPEVMDDIPSAYRSGITAYETWKVSNIPNLFAKSAQARGQYDGPIAGSDEIWKISQGMLTPQKAPYGKGGEAISHYHEWIESGDALAEFMELKNAGQTRGRFLDYITQKVYEDYGDTAISNDIVWQTTLDPLNFAPFGVGKAGQFVTGKIAKGATDVNTIRIATQMNDAFKMGTGNPFIDALPIGVQQLVKGITHTQDSAGLIGTYKIYQGMIRGNYLSSLARSAPTDVLAKVDALVKDGVKADEIKFLDDTITWKDAQGNEQVFKSAEHSRIDIPEIDDLSDFEKLVGGIDEEYGLKELRPVVGEKWARKLSKLTPAAQVTAIMNTFHQNFASLAEASGSNPEVLIKSVKQMAGQVGIEKGDLGESILKSAESRAVQAALKYSLEDGDIIDNIYSSWVAGAERRAMLEKIAVALDTTPAEVLQGLKDKPDVMAKRLNKIAPELQTSPEHLTETLKVFMGDDALPWNAEQFQASMVVKVADKMDGYFQDVYGLKPESYVFRLSNVFKSVQSLVLLGLNPAYLMNNWVNNVVTRAAEGVGGYMTGPQINDFYERMGMFPKDTGLSGYDDITGRVVHEAMEVKDNLGQIQRAITKVNNKIGIFTRLSGWSEKMEGNQARVAAAKQFLGKEKKVGTGIRGMDPITERILDQRYPGLKEGIYGAVNAGLNMREIEASIKAQVVTPKIESILDEIGVKYDKTTPGGARDLFDRMGLTDRLNDRLANADTDAKVDAAFDAVGRDVEDFIRKARDEELKHIAEDVKNKAQTERLPFVLQSFGDMIIENTQLWINSRKDWERLYALQANDAINKTQFHNIASSLNEKHIADWNNFNDRQLQTMKGIIEGLGIDNEYTRTFIQRTADTHGLWKDFWQERKKLLKRYFSQGDDGKLTWDEVETQLGEMYDATTKKVVGVQAELDGLFARSYKEFTGWDETAAVQWRAGLFKMQQELFAKQSAMRERTKGMDQTDRDIAYSVFNEEYNAAIAKMKQLEHDGAYSLMNKPAPAMNIDIPEVPNPVVDKMVTDTVKGELENRGYTPEEVNELLPDQPAQPLQPVRQPNPIIEKAKEVVKAKITAEDIIAQADAKLREKLISDNGMIGREDYIKQMREAEPNATEAEIAAAVEINNLMIDQWGRRNGYGDGKAVQDAWYATNIAGIKKETGGLQPGELPLANKGAAQRLADGRVMIKFFESADFSTAVHEPMHVWLWNLPARDIDVVARLGGLSGADEFRALREQFNDGTLTQGMPDYDRYVRAEEDFARGHERYLTEGDAPTPELRSLFRQFTDWMISIYQALQKAMGRVTGFEKTSIGVDIRTQVNGRSLRDIFDSMLVDKVDRSPTFDQLVSDRFSDVKQRGRNAVRFKDQPAELTKMAQRELIGEMFKDFASQDEARAFVDTMSDYANLPDGTKLDDVALYDAMRFIDDNPDINPWNQAEYKQVMGGHSTASGVGDRTVKYPVQFKVIDLDNLIPSDVIQGNNLIPNPAFTIPDIQNRITNAKTGEVSNRMGWITIESSRLDPEGMLFDSKEAQLGSPIVSSDNMVASGNGRVALLQYARENYPDEWMKYQQALPKYAADAGISPEAYADMKNPVLVRELDPSVDVVKFAKDTNKPAVAVMTPTELALNDANNITPDMLRLLNVLDDEEIYSALKQTRNDKFINKFMETLTSNEKAGITTDNELNQAGIERIVNALISKVYNTADGEAMLDTFRNSKDNNIKTLQSAIMASLPQMAYVEGMIQYGMRSPGLSIADDVAFAANKISSLRDQGMSAGEYLGQMGLFGDVATNLTPAQLMLLTLFDSKAPKKIREALRKYAAKVDKQPAIGQETVATLIRTKEDILNDAIFGTDQPAQQGDIFGQRPDAGVAETVQGDELARPETAGEVQPIPTGDEGVPGMVEPIQGAEQPAVRQPWEIRGEQDLQSIIGYSPEEAATIAADLRRKRETGRQTWEVPLGEFIEPARSTRTVQGAIENEKFAREIHKMVVRQALSEGKPVPPEVLADYPDLVAKNVIDTETKADYDAGKPVPIERAAEIDIAHTEVSPVPEDVQTLIDKAQSYRMEKKQQASDYVQWVLDGEKGPRPDVADSIVADYANSIDTLREYAAQKARGVTAEETVQPSVPTTPQIRIVVNNSGNVARVIKQMTDQDLMLEQSEYGSSKIHSLASNWKDATTADIDAALAKSKERMTKERLQGWKDQLSQIGITQETDISQNGITPNVVRTRYDLTDAEYTQSIDMMKDLQFLTNQAEGYTKIPTFSDLEDIIMARMNVDRDVAHQAKNTLEQKNWDRKMWSEGRKSPQLSDYPELAEALGMADIVKAGIKIQRAYKFKHGDVECVANAYKDGELIAYVPAVPLKDAQLDADTRILGLDPQFPDKWVYEQDGVIKTVDSRKPEIAQPAQPKPEIPQQKITIMRDPMIPNDRYYFNTPNGFIEDPTAKKIVLSTSWAAEDLFIRKNEFGNYVVTEAKTGMALGKTDGYKLRREAIEAAEAGLNKIGLVKYWETIDSWVQKGTYSPRYKEESRNTLFQRGQTDVFSQGAEDMPLFSGTPMRAEQGLFEPKEASPQMSMFPDIVPEAKPTTIIEIAIKEKGATSYIRLDIKKTKAIRDTLKLHEGAEMTARIMDAKGKVIESNLDPNDVVNPKMGGNALFQAAETATKDWYYSQLGRVLETMPNKITPDALRGFLNGKVKADELQWTGFEKWMGEQQGQISKQDALDFITENRVVVEEVLRGQPNLVDLPKWTKLSENEYEWIEPSTGHKYSIVGHTDGTDFWDLRLNGIKSDAFLGLARTMDKVTTFVKNKTTAISSKYGDYTLPGGENYRELLLTLPPKQTKYTFPTFEEYKDFYAVRGYGGTDAEIRNDYEHDLSIEKFEYELLKETGNIPYSNNYQSPHWSEPNVLAHIRFDDRVDADGKRVLFIEEIQSDRHQAGREEGYGTELTISVRKNNDPDADADTYDVLSNNNVVGYVHADNEQTAFDSAIRNFGGSRMIKGVPAAPFSKSWEELSIKRMIRYAAENGYDRVAWTTGKMQADRYNLAKQVKHIAWELNDDGTYNINAPLPDGKPGIYKEDLSIKEVKELVGKDITDKILAGEGRKDTESYYRDWNIIEGEENLAVGGAGMNAFYDNKIPSIVQKYIKKWGGEVGETNIEASSFDYTNTPVGDIPEEHLYKVVSADGGDLYDLTKTAEQAQKSLGDAINYQPNSGWKIEQPKKPLKSATEQEIVQKFDITPAMRDSVVNQGQPLFQGAEPDNTAPIGKVPLNGTPTIEPYARMLDEVNSEHIRPMMDDIKQSYKEKLKNPGYKWGEVAAEHQKLVTDYLKGTVNNDLATVKNQAMKYGQMMRNNALLDYSRRYGADAVLQTVFPYQFWYTRTMMNWAKRMVDKPAWFAMYARMQASREKMEREGMPTRLRGKMRINMPWMPEWMGGGIWTDPMAKIFPFHQFGIPFEQYSNNQVMINRRAESILDEMKENELISATDADNAKASRAGTVWENALAQAELELDKSANPTSLVTMMMQPALWWTIPANIAKGTPEKMSPLPITRTGQTIKELGRDTFLEPATDIVGGILAGPETAIRKKAGLSEFGQWGDYYVDRMLAGMAAAGEISTDDARIAMLDRQGPAFDTALQRIRTEQSLRTPGALGITALKEGAKPGQVLAATLAGIFGGSLFSEGEMKMRGLKPIYDNAWNKLKAGDESALNDFYDQYPEYSARLALYDEPEERLHQFLIDNVWRNYMDLDNENKKLVREALGDEFMDSFLNKETRSYESIDDKTLAYWSQTIKPSPMPQAMGDVKGSEMNYYADPMVQAINTYKDERTQRFPNYYMWQNAYYELPAGAERKAFLAAHPQLKQYWDWKDEYAVQNPEIVPYFDELKQKSTGDVVSSELTQPLIRQLYTYATGGSLSAGAKSELERIRKQYASEMSSEEFVMLALALIMGGQ